MCSGCVYVRCLYRGHACIHNGQNTLLLQGDLSGRAAKWNVRLGPGITAIAVVLMQCHTLHTQSHSSSTLLRLCMWVCVYLFSGLVSIYRVLDCRHISPWGRCVNMSAKSHCCRRGLRFVLMK
jgi:hypothetical protein